MSRAFISVDRGIVALERGSGFTLRCLDEDLPMEVDQKTFGTLFRGTDDLCTVECTTLEDAFQQLHSRRKLADSLSLFWILLNAERTIQLRKSSAEALYEIWEEDIVVSLRNVLFTAPLPVHCDIDVARDICVDLRYQGLVDFFEPLATRQFEIAQVRDAWEAIPIGAFLSEHSKDPFWKTATYLGLQYALSSHIEDVDSVVVEYLLKPEWSKSAEARKILMCWIRPLQRNTLDRDRIVEDEDKTTSEFVKPRGQKRSNHELYQNATAQIDTIKTMMMRGQLVLVNNWISELVTQQRRTADPEQIAMSLCNLASYAKELGMTRLQLDLCRRAVEEYSKDAWSRVQLADALAGLGKFDEALEQYGYARVFGKPAMAATGEAEVMRRLGRLDESIALYDLAYLEFSQNVVPHCGRAQVLLEMGKMEKALRAYEEAVAAFPNDVVPRCGRAQVLLEMGELEKALRAYEETAAAFPNDVVPHCGRAQALLEMGEMEKALRAYEETATAFPNEVVPHNGRAQVLLEMGQLEKALRAYEETAAAFPNDVIPHSGRAQVLLEMGQFEKALRAYEEIAAIFPHDVVPRNGQAQVLLEMGELEKALRAYEETADDFPYHVVPRNGQAQVLLEMGQLEKALRAFQETAAAFPYDVVPRNGQARVLLEMGEMEEALQAYEETAAAFPHDVVPRCGRAQVLLEMGELEKALRAYEETAAAFPHKLVPRNGRIHVLYKLGRYDESLELVPVITQKPVKQSEWVAIHMRGMIHLRKNEIEEALEIFDFGATNCLRPRDQAYFQTARAITRIRQERFRDALDSLPKPAGRLINNVVNVFRFHAAGELGDVTVMGTSVEALSTERYPLIVEVREELRRRYIDRQLNLPTHSDDWLFEREIDLLTRVA